MKNIHNRGKTTGGIRVRFSIEEQISELPKTPIHSAVRIEILEGSLTSP